MRRARPSRAFSGSAGSILLEVMFATLLVGILVVPLANAFARAVGEARVVRERAEQERAAAGASGADEEWEWGPGVVAAWWEPGPVLHIRVSGRPPLIQAGAEVGLWVNGWLVAEEAIASDENGAPVAAESLQVGPGIWDGRAGNELVIRVRASAGGWGPPWRLAVAAQDGGTPALASASSVLPQGPTVVVRRPGLSTSSLSVTWVAGPIISPPFALLFSLTPALEGWGGATLDGRSQWWFAEEGRSVDLYF